MCDRLTESIQSRMSLLDILESSEPDDSEDEPSGDYGSVAYAARNYQLELFEHAKENNIMVLGTGSGKTFIAILLIKHREGQLSGSFPGEAKRTIMLANSVPLLRQQAKAVEQHVPYNVGAFDGSMGVDFWDKEKASKASNGNDEAQTKDEKAKANKAVRGCFDPWAEQSIPDKMIADSVEALLGTWLLTCGPCSTHQLLFMFGFPIGAPIQVPRSAVLDHRIEAEGPSPDAEVDRLYKHYMLNRFENVVGYTFRNKSFLLQAVTHPTFTANKVTHCYQRLEFLGDAVLDYLVTGHVFASPKLSPSRITDIRSHYVCNSTLARACVKAKIHRFLLHHCASLQGTIDSYVTLVEGAEESGSGFVLEAGCTFTRPDESPQNNSESSVLNGDIPSGDGATVADAPSSELNMESDVMTAEQVEVPKVLGDLVEAVIGAVYLDSDLSLNVCWKVVQRLIPDLERANFERAGIDCVRLMHEHAEIENKEKIAPDTGRLAEFRVKVKGLDWLTGRGKNLRCAKQAAAKLVLQRLGRQQHCGDAPAE